MFIFSNVALLYLFLPVFLIFLFTYLLCFRYLAAMLKWRNTFCIIPSSGWNDLLIIKFLTSYPSSPILVSSAWAFVSEYRFWRKHVAEHFYENLKSLPLKEGKPFLPASGPLCAAHTGGSSLGCAPHICLPSTSVCPSCYDKQRCLWLPICLKTMKYTKPSLLLGGCCCSLYRWPFLGTDPHGTPTRVALQAHMWLAKASFDRQPDLMVCLGLGYRLVVERSPSLRKVLHSSSESHDSLKSSISMCRWEWPERREKTWRRDGEGAQAWGPVSTAHMVQGTTAWSRKENVQGRGLESTLGEFPLGCSF